MTKMPYRARKVSFSPLMLAILGIWFLANLLSQLAYINFNGAPYDGIGMLESLGSIYYAVIVIELLLWAWLVAFLVKKLVRHLSSQIQTTAENVNSR